MALKKRGVTTSFFYTVLVSRTVGGVGGGHARFRNHKLIISGKYDTIFGYRRLTRKRRSGEDGYF